MSQVALQNLNLISSQNPPLGQALTDVQTQLNAILTQIATLQTAVTALQAKVK
jgi:hypothetical protein